MSASEKGRMPQVLSSVPIYGEQGTDDARAVPPCMAVDVPFLSRSDEFEDERYSGAMLTDTLVVAHLDFL